MVQESKKDRLQETLQKRLGESGTHHALINARLAQMTLDIVKLIALVVRVVSLDRHRLRHELLMRMLLLEILLLLLLLVNLVLLLLAHVLAGFDGDGRGESMRRVIVLRSAAGGRRHRER